MQLKLLAAKLTRNPIPSMTFFSVLLANPATELTGNALTGIQKTKPFSHIFTSKKRNKLKSKSKKYTATFNMQYVL